MPSPILQPLAIHYGLRLDAYDEFVQGYVDGMRLDQRGQGVACGRGWIPRSKKCSRDKASQTSKEAKARTVEKAKARAKLKGEVKAAKGQKARVKDVKPMLPELKGTEKQVKWAQRIRNDMMEHLESLRDDPLDSTYHEYVSPLIDVVRSVKTAKAFIDVNDTWHLGMHRAPGLLIDFKKFQKYSKSGTLEAKKDRLSKGHLTLFLEANT